MIFLLSAGGSWYSFCFCFCNADGGLEVLRALLLDYGIVIDLLCFRLGLHSIAPRVFFVFQDHHSVSHRFMFDLLLHVMLLMLCFDNVCECLSAFQDHSVPHSSLFEFATNNGSLFNCRRPLLLAGWPGAGFVQMDQSCSRQDRQKHCPSAWLCKRCIATVFTSQREPSEVDSPRWSHCSVVGGRADVV